MKGGSKEAEGALGSKELGKRRNEEGGVCLGLKCVCCVGGFKTHLSGDLLIPCMHTRPAKAARQRTQTGGMGAE